MATPKLSTAPFSTFDVKFCQASDIYLLQWRITGPGGGCRSRTNCLFSENENCSPWLHLQ